MTSQINLSGCPDNPDNESKDQQRCNSERDQKPIHEPYRAFVRAWSPRASRVETDERECSSFLFSVRNSTTLLCSARQRRTKAVLSA